MSPKQLFEEALEVKAKMDIAMLNPPMEGDRLYMCLICGQLNNYWSICQRCEDPLGGDGIDD